MLLILFGSLVGIVLGLLIDFYLLIVLCFLSIIIFSLKRKNVYVFIFFILLFFVYTKNQINKYDTKYKPGYICDDYKIISYADEGEYYNKYICKNSKNDKFLIYIPSKRIIKKGEVIKAEGEFVLPDLVRNTGGFNYRRYLNSQKIYGSIFVKKFEVTYIGKFNLIYYIQEEIYETFDKLFPKNEMGLILGMLIGETKDISEETMENFKDIGITHLVAVSGSNVMYVLAFVQIIFNKLCGKRKTYFISIFFIIIFMLVSGASSSVVRATIMTVLMILSDIFYKKSDTLNNISISAFILMIISPLIIYDVGFILSFGGTIGIVLLSKDLKKVFDKHIKFSETLATTCSAQIVLVPIMAYYFNSFSIISIITNLIVVPISGFITILGFFIFLLSKIFFPLSILFSKVLYVLVSFTIFISNIFSKIPFSSIKVITPNFFEIIFFYFVVFFSLGKIKTFYFEKNIKTISIMIFCFLLMDILFYSFSKRYVDVNFIDVGQGDAIYIETVNHKKILIDGGGSKTYDVGQNILVPYLLDKRVLYIDAIFSSHSDDDHIDGILTVMKDFKVGTVYIAKNAIGYEELFLIAKEKNINVELLEMGDNIKLDEIFFEVIGPPKNILYQDVNAYSLVLKMKYGDKSVLFTGDINQDTEGKLGNVNADVLKVAHHGSESSSKMSFIARVNPQISVIQVGKNNKYGHPNQEVINRLKIYSTVYTTADNGEVKIKLYKDKIIVE